MAQRFPRNPLRSLLARPSRGPVALLLAGLFACGAVPAVAAAAAIPVGAAAPAEVPRELVPWDDKGDFAAALARARKEKKHVFIDFYATWCGPCKMMDRQTYTDQAVAKAAAKYVNRKVDAEKGEGIALAQRYSITAYPTLLIVDATGRELARETGFRSPDKFTRFLDDVREGRGTIEGIEKLIAGGQDTAENRLALGEKYAERGDAERARAQFDRVRELDPADSSGRAADLLLLIAGTQRAAGAHEAAVRDYERWIALYPASPRLAEAQTGMAVSLAASGRPEEGFALYRTYAAGHADDAQVQSAVARFSAALKVGLDDGLVAARRAVELSQGGANAYDALAEIHAARDEWDEAVVAAEHALAQRPKDNYLRARLEKFQEGAAAAVRNRNRGGD